MAIIYLRSSSHIKASMMRDDHLFLQNCIRSLLNIIILPILISRRDLHSYSI